MEKIVYIGKAIGEGDDAFATVEINSGRLSISGVIGPMANGSMRGSCGQISDTLRKTLDAGRLELAPGWDDSMARAFLEVWDQWHLNSMRPYCEHQKALGWRELARQPRTLYHWRLSSDVLSQQKALQQEAIDRAASTTSTALGFSPEEKRVLKLEWALVTTTPDLSGYDLKYYEKPSAGLTAHEETKTRGWLHEEEHPDGLLSKACPVCAYKYGNAWQMEELPPLVVEFLEGLPAPEKDPVWV